MGKRAKPMRVSAYDHSGREVATFNSVNDIVTWLVTEHKERYPSAMSAYSLVRQHLGGRPMRTKSKLRKAPRAPFRFAKAGTFVEPIVVVPQPHIAKRREKFQEFIDAGFIYAYTLGGTFKAEISTVEELEKLNSPHRSHVLKQTEDGVILPGIMLRKALYDGARPMTLHGADRSDGYVIEIVEPLTGSVLATVNGVVAAEKIFGWHRSKISECANGLKEMYKGFIIRKKEE